MKTTLNTDNKFFEWMGKIGDLIILNLLWVVFCIPIITIGASTTALYHVSLRWTQDKEPYIGKSFIKAFKEKFVKSTILWLLVILGGIILAIDIRIAVTSNNLFGKILIGAVAAIGIIYIWVTIYIFPLVARFDYTVMGFIKKAIIMSVFYLPYTVAICAIILLPFVVWIGIPLVSMYLYPVWVLMGGSITAISTSYFFQRIFAGNMARK